MSGETVITVAGNLTGDPELRFTPSGAAVASFTIASTPRSFDRASNEWKDGETVAVTVAHPVAALCGESRRCTSGWRAPRGVDLSATMPRAYRLRRGSHRRATGSAGFALHQTGGSQ